MKKMIELQKFEAAHKDVCEIINDSSEHGQFNSSYFREPFMKWYAEQWDEIENNKSGTCG